MQGMHIKISDDAALARVTMVLDLKDVLRGILVLPLTQQNMAIQTG